MIILAIETSCDDTAVALVEVKGKKMLKFKVLANFVSSQVKLHAKYGGVYPSLAKREHQKNLPIVLKRALEKAGKPKIDLLAVTVGPGLEPCLWTGINFTKELAKQLKVPLIPVNHIEAHVLVNLISQDLISARRKIFPAISLVVSGGHSQLILVKGIGKYKILGETRDDAAGECFDKVARILKLGYPGGPLIDRWAAECRAKVRIPKFAVKLPRPMIFQKNYDFSFSGLKTAVLYDFRNRSPKVRRIKAYIQEIAKETQQAIIDVLIFKTFKAAKNFKAKAVIIGGGVAASKELRKQFKKSMKKELPKVQFLTPPAGLSTDNAVMVGLAAYFNCKRNLRGTSRNISARANLRVRQ